MTPSYTVPVGMSLIGAIIIMIASITAKQFIG